MLVLLSPAKSLDLEPAPEHLPHSTPALLDEAAKLAAVCRRKSPRKLGELMSISDKLAVLNHDRFQAWSERHTPLNSKQAALLFDGDTYKGFDASTLSEDDLTWAQEHVAILSGLYGVLRPLDLVQPYRLEMGTRLKTRRGENLYGFWKDRIGDRLGELVQGHEAPVLVNCASNEYFSAVKGKKVPRVIEPEFKEVRGDGRLQTISFFAKRARGALARWVVQNRAETVEQLADFDLLGYEHQADLSEGDTLVFSRLHPNEH